MDAMENQMKAEREKRAEIAHSVGEMETVINLSRAAYEEAVNISEGEKERMINEAEGQAREIVAVAEATADGIKKLPLLPKFKAEWKLQNSPFRKNG